MGVGGDCTVGSVLVALDHGQILSFGLGKCFPNSLFGFLDGQRNPTGFLFSTVIFEEFLLDFNGNVSCRSGSILSSSRVAHHNLVILNVLELGSRRCDSVRHCFALCLSCRFVALVRSHRAVFVRRDFGSVVGSPRKIDDTLLGDYVDSVIAGYSCLHQKRRNTKLGS